MTKGQSRQSLTAPGQGHPAKITGKNVGSSELRHLPTRLKIVGYSCRRLNTCSTCRRFDHGPRGTYTTVGLYSRRRVLSPGARHAHEGRQITHQSLSPVL